MKKSALFAAKIGKLGINPVVDPPDKVLEYIFARACRSSGPISVCGKINGFEFIQTLVKYRGAWRLYVNTEMLRASGLSVHDVAQIEIEYDPRPRDVAIPKLFASALERNSTAKTAFQKLPPSRQKEILKYLGALKSRNSLERNVDKVIDQLSGHPATKPHMTLRRKK